MVDPDGLVAIDDQGNKAKVDYNPFSLQLPNGGKIKGDVVKQQTGTISVVQTSATYITPNDAKDVYIEGVKDFQPSIVDLDIILGAVLTEKYKIPYVGKALVIYEVSTWYDSYVDKIFWDKYEEVMNKGQGVVVVRGELRGDPRAAGSFYNIYPWKDSNYGSYPYISY